MAEHEIEEIVDILSNRRIIEGISVFADIADIKRRNYSFSAGSFFEAKIEYEDITVEQFNEKLSGYMTELEELMHESEKSHQELLVVLGSVRYDL